MDFFSVLIEGLTGWGYLLLVFFFGLWFTVRLKGIQFCRLFTAVKMMFSPEKEGSEKNFSSFEAAFTALAGAMGTGNIAGVATAISLGGAGSIFWMAVSAFLAMALKYAEIFLAVKYRDPGGTGGPMYYMKKLPFGHGIAVWFCLSAILASFGIGNLTQASSASAAFCSGFQQNCISCGILLAALFTLTVFGGQKSIGRINSIVIPVITVLYLLFSFAVLAVNRENLLLSIERIFCEAFRFSSVAGGAAGFFAAKAIRYGISRGIFSNEAGLGSSAIAHGGTCAQKPGREALWGIAEVFLDTVLMCTLTGLVILCSGADQSGLESSLMTAAAFSSIFGEKAVAFIGVISIIYAAASMSGWYYYGTVALSFLLPKKRLEPIYFLLFLVLIFVGCFLESEFVFALADFLNLMMALPNLLALFLLRKEVTTA